jgi:3-oxoacyl-[acyl-carrier protein] reductase
MEIKGAVAIVTGSSSVTGIGAETAKLLASRGARVVVNYSANKAGAEETAAHCVAAGGAAIVVKGDVSKDEDCRRLAAAAIETWGRLDILVNNAATTRPIPQKDLESLDAAEFHRILSVNLIGAFQMTRAAAPHLRAAGDAAVVNISSVGGWRSAGSSMAYSASKGALNTMTIGLARVLAPEVRVNAICPGGLIGNWTRKILTEEAYAKRIKDAETRYPLRRPVLPADVARTALFLIEGASTMTGELIRMDSGQHLL